MAKSLKATIKSALASTAGVIGSIIALVAIFDLLNHRSLSNIGDGLVRFITAIGGIAGALATFVEKGGVVALLLLVALVYYVVKRLRSK